MALSGGANRIDGAVSTYPPP